jgi:mono/diheme cytochrome c family protein
MPLHRRTSARHWATAVATVVLGAGLVAALPSCTTMSQYSVSPHEYSGVRLYQTFCASCHGLTGLGDGPIEPLIHGGVPDLTRIAERRGGKFPVDEIRDIVDGRETLIAHGTSQMPVWGFEFRSADSDAGQARAQADRTVDRLLKYLETIQPGYYK